MGIEFEVFIQRRFNYTYPIFKCDSFSSSDQRCGTVQSASSSFYFWWGLTFLVSLFGNWVMATPLTVVEMGKKGVRQRKDFFKNLKRNYNPVDASFLCSCQLLFYFIFIFRFKTLAKIARRWREWKWRRCRYCMVFPAKIKSLMQSPVELHSRPNVSDTIDWWRCYQQAAKVLLTT